jgi:hypothetical protein
MWLAMWIGLALLLFAMHRLVRCWPLVRLALASRSWPSTAGEITYLSIGADMPIEADASRPYLHYSYSVAGEPYMGTRIRAGDEYAGVQRLRRLLAEHYPVGRFVRVYYNPLDPEEAVLEPGLAQQMRNGIVLITLPLLLFGGYLTFGALLAALMP